MILRRGLKEDYDLTLTAKGRAFILVLQSKLPSFTVSPMGAENAFQSSSAVGPVKAKVAFKLDKGSETRYLNSQGV